MRLDLPTGTVTFLFTDVEGSTRLLHELGAEGYAEALAEHRRLIRQACAAQGGVEVDNQGDAFFFAFASAPGASAAASELTRALGTGPIRVRVGLHTGAPLLTEEGYVGDDVHVAARVASSGHGGQVLLSQVTRELLDERFPLASLGSHRLKDIAEAVSLYQLGEGSFPPLKTIANTNLPTPASGFLGREAELYEADLLLQGTRLLTVTGPGGQGKTRFSLELARRAREERFSDYADGVFSCFLSSLRDPSLVLATLCQTLSVHEQAGQSALETLSSHLAAKKLLLVIDNLEHLLACAPELSQLLQACPNLTLLCTSRELLRLSGELAYELPPLAEAEGVALFCERARVEPSATIVELCRRLEGLPLALELAAARLRLLSPEQLLGRLSSRLDLLKGTRDADPRQLTLRATIQWSYDLLALQEQQLFARLSVFRGGCTLRAAEEVCEADVDTLESLLDKSLLRRTDSEQGPRFWMLETIREFAEELLDASSGADAVRRRHAEWFLALAEEYEPTPMGALDETAISQLLAELDNLRVAIELFSELPEPTDELRLVGSLFRFWEAGGLVVEGRQAAERALARAHEADSRLRLNVLYAAALCAFNQGDWQAARRYSEERLEIARMLDDERMVAVALNDLGVAAVLSGDAESGTAFYEESRVLAAQIGESQTVVSATSNLADVALIRGDYSSAREFAEEAIMLTSPDDSWRIHPESNRAFALLGLGEVELAAEKFRETIDLVRRVFGPVYAVDTLDGLAAVAAACGEFGRAARLAGSAREIRDRGSFQAHEQIAELAEQTARAGGEALGAERWEHECAHGAAMTLDEAVAYALEESSDA